MWLMPERIKQQTGRYSRVDGIPYELPINSQSSPALMAAFTIDARKAAELLPGNEVHPLRLWGNKGVLFVTVVDYRETDIGPYIEFSLAIACTYGTEPAPPLLPLLFQKHYRLGQYVMDLPVSTEISVKGGKGIWGMPKHQANLDFRIDEHTVSSQYDKDGQFAVRIEIERPPRTRLSLRASAANYCQFRGMLMKSYIYFHGKFGFRLGRRASARLTIGDHPRVQPLRTLGISSKPFFVGFFPASSGVLDDHFECWFLSYPSLPAAQPEGMESVVGLGLSQQWLPPPREPALGAPPMPEAPQALEAPEPRRRIGKTVGAETHAFRSVVLRTLNACLLFLCASMYLGTGWSLVLFTFPIAPQLTVDNYYLEFVPQVTAATHFFTWMTLVMLLSSGALFIEERRSRLRWYPAVVFLGVVAATLLTRFVIFRYNAEMAAGIVDPGRLAEVLAAWMTTNRIRVGLWTVQWLAMMCYFAHKVLRAERPTRLEAKKPTTAGPKPHRWVEAEVRP
ncbi:acetoacetate decarboxylase family protein [Polyangium sp. y55x31]|nr:acetoacetate decarboxylase family protein [Polyangium sp. y55x31]MDI1483406.1 acetoacetate decarboxylase family protein [Polyangium sp. y55x31]